MQSIVPTNVAVQYNHRLVHTSDNNAGANERAGFIDAPDIKPIGICRNIAKRQSLR